MDMIARSPSHFDPLGLQYVWNSTSIQLAETCLYKYKLKVLYGWRPATHMTKLAAAIVAAGSPGHWEFVFFSSFSRPFDVAKSVVVPFVKLVVGTEGEAPLETGKSNGNLRRVDHNPFHRLREDSPAGEGVEGHLGIGGITLEVPRSDGCAGGFLILDEDVVAVISDKTV